MRNTFHLRCPSKGFFAIYPFLLLFFIATSGFSQETTDQKEAGAEHVVNESYAYVIEGRADPFKPFISPKATTPAGQDPNEIVDDSTELAGMRLFEPGQLTLVGVLTSGDAEVALVEDQTRKGYMLKIGDLIGKRGVVTQIDKKQVVVTETARTRAGEEINSTVIMRLNKEGDR
jgi:type IV pilus assembly protein PilP